MKVPKAELPVNCLQRNLPVIVIVSKDFNARKCFQATYQCLFGHLSLGIMTIGQLKFAFDVISDIVLRIRISLSMSLIIYCKLLENSFTALFSPSTQIRVMLIGEATVASIQ